MQIHCCWIAAELMEESLGAVVKALEDGAKNIPRTAAAFVGSPGEPLDSRVHAGKAGLYFT